MTFTSYHVGVAAEAAAASLFARCGADVLVQYGANQPEFDLVVSKHKERSDRTLKVSVKGSKDGSWGLTQSLKNKEVTYLAAIETWLNRHNTRTIFCLVQFKNAPWNEMPRMYLATPLEIADRLRATANGRGDTILYESHEWGPRAVGAGTIERIPLIWRFTEERLEELLNAGNVC
jgi:hypothetical protein